MHLESCYSGIAFDPDRTVRALWSMGYFRVARKGDELVGMFAGGCEEYFFGPELLAMEYIWYVRPANRGSRAALLLLRDFESWALGLGCREVCIGTSTGFEYDGLMEKLGYRKTGGIYKR